MTDIKNDFLSFFNNRKYFWHVFKRSVSSQDLNNLKQVFDVLVEYDKKNWFKKQTEYCTNLQKKNLLNPSAKNQELTANARGLKKVFENLGFCFVDKEDQLIITEMGYKFHYSNRHNLLAIKTEQLVKYQIYNETINIKELKEMRIKPFIFLLRVLLAIDGNSITAEEFRLFVFRASNDNQLTKILIFIQWWRKLSLDNKNSILQKLQSSEKTNRGVSFYKKILGYVSYSINFFGDSAFTFVEEFDGVREIYLNPKKKADVSTVINDKDLNEFQSSYLENNKYFQFYTKSILKENFISNNTYTEILGLRIESNMNLNERTSNCLKNENIIFIRDLIECSEKTLLSFPNFGKKSLDDLNYELSLLNKKFNTNYRIGQHQYNLKNITANESKTFSTLHIQELSNLEENLSKNKILFSDLSKEDQITFFLPLESLFSNENRIDTRIVNTLKNQNIFNFGDLHQSFEMLDKNYKNFGLKSYELVKDKVKIVNLSYETHVVDWDIIKKEKFAKFNKLVSENLELEQSKKTLNIKSFEEEFDIILKNAKMKFNEIERIKYFFGIEDGRKKTLQTAADKFKVTRERIRQVLVKFSQKVKRLGIISVYCKKIYLLLIDISPISKTDFANKLIENKLTKGQIDILTLFELFKIFGHKNIFYISTLNETKVINNEKKTSISDVKNYLDENLNKVGFVEISQISSKFNLNKKSLISCLKNDNNYKFIENSWIYLNNKIRNRLYNSLVKIFNVSNIINKFDLMKSLDRLDRINLTNFDLVLKYCEIEFNAKITSEKIEADKSSIPLYYLNTNKKILSDKDLIFISCFDNQKIHSYSSFFSSLLEKKINKNTAGIYIYKCPFIVKKAPQIFSLVGANISPDELEDFINLQKKYDKSFENVCDYDYTGTDTIKLVYKITEKIIANKSFYVPKSIQNILNGNFTFLDENKIITVKKSLIEKYPTEILHEYIRKDFMISFHFNITKKNVEVKIEKEKTII